MSGRKGAAETPGTLETSEIESAAGTTELSGMTGMSTETEAAGLAGTSAASEEGGKEGEILLQLLTAEKEALETLRNQREAANSLDYRQKAEYRDTIALLEKYGEECAGRADSENPFPRIRRAFDRKVKAHQSQVKDAGQALENVFAFLERTWGRGKEMVLFMTELTANEDSMLFLEMWGSDSYFKYNQDLLIYDVHQKLRQEIADLALEE